MPVRVYPSAADIEVVLKSGAFWPTDARAQLYARRQAQVAAESAAAEAEHIMGWGPALALRDDNGELLTQTRYFEGGDHNGDLQLGGGLLVSTETPFTVSIGGVAQTRDYAPFLKYLTRDTRSPVVTIRSLFGNYGGGGWSSGYGYGQGGGARIAITGVWGKFLELPADIFEVCQHKAIANMMDYIYNEQSIGSISQDGFSQSFDITGVRTQQNIAETGAKNFNSLCQSHQRPYLG